MYKKSKIVFLFLISISLLTSLVLCGIDIYNHYTYLQKIKKTDYKEMNRTVQIIEKLSHENFNQSENQIDKNMPPVGRIQNKKQLSHGTAFIIDDHTIITNYHVIKKGLKKQGLKHFEFTPHKKPVEFKNNEYVPAFSTPIIDKHKIKDVDLVVLKTKKNLHAYGQLKLSNNTPNKYQETTSFGYPNPKFNKNIDDSKMTRTIYRFIKKDNHKQKFYVKGVIHPGSSGSPMLNEPGYVYGVASFRHSDDIDQGVSGGVLLNHHIIKNINTHKEEFEK